MNGRAVAVSWLLGALLGLAACGEETALLVEVELGGRSASSEVDLIHLELREDGQSLIGRNFRLAASDSRPLFELTPGGRTPNTFELVAYAYLNEVLLAQTPAAVAEFREGERVSLTLELPPR